MWFERLLNVCRSFRVGQWGIGARFDRRRWVAELGFLCLVAASIYPLWSVQHLPFQDLPQHLAAVSLLRHYWDPAFGFSKYFQVTLGDTQYLTYYLAVDLLSYAFDVELANRVVLTAAVGGLPYALRSLLRSLGKQDSVGLFALPLTYNVHLILGFLNFVAALPLCFWGLALCVQERNQPSRRRALALSLLGLFLFLTHIVPFAFWAAGAVLVFVGDGWKRSALRMAPLVPSAIAAALWGRSTRAGHAVLGALGFRAHEGGPRPEFQDWSSALRELPGAMTDVLHGSQDDMMLVGWGLLLMLTFVFGVGEPSSAGTGTALRLNRRLALLAPVAMLAYFISPTAYDWIWPINWRFPVLAALFTVLILPPLRGLAWAVVVPAIAVLSLSSFALMTRMFRLVEAEELGDLDGALQHIPPRQKVAGLIWNRTSDVLKFAPFLHSVAWYQVRKGGAVMFTFAEFPQSPFHFKPEMAPPPARPRWEWRPDLVDPTEELTYYDYVLTRGGPGPIINYPEQWLRVFRDEHWAVWKRSDP